MFASPLAWFETSGISPQYRESVAPLIATWKQHRERIHRGMILPIGDEPDGVSWTGFTSLDTNGSGYILVFREANAAAQWVVPTDLSVKATVLGGDGKLTRAADGHWTANATKPLGFLWVQIEAYSNGAKKVAHVQ